MRIKNQEQAVEQAVERSRSIKDLTGRVFSSWTVVGPYRIFQVPGGKKRTYWTCRCVCGKEELILPNTLQKGQSNSCGCQKAERNKISTLERFGNTNRLSKHIRYQYFDMLIKRIEHLPLIKKMTNDITEEYLDDLFFKQDFKCALSGLPVGFDKNHYAGRSASLDRIDSSKGYEIGNVQWTHKHVNRMKNNYDEAYFVRMCTAVAEHKK